MPMKLTKKKATLAGDCVVDDAENLLQWLVNNKQCQLDLSGVSHLHASVLQAIAAVGNGIASLPADAFLADSIAQLRKGH